MKTGAYKHLYFEYQNGKLDFVHLRLKDFKVCLPSYCLKDDIRLEKWSLVGKKYQMTRIVYQRKANAWTWRLSDIPNR